ncbi:uncharacterized protein LOC115881379 [Sitophilus oryzae]|uniref:Uncharacterized protein LOC115881379 n=1 Tax=Sitophilus oryzae TaxID=7048 RepID=A0A6J2XVR2_SITOR|nr:uncharacterized protein LOC115881379 [Sitophilus oryzae]
MFVKYAFRFEVIFLLVLTTELLLQFVAGSPCVRFVTQNHSKDPYCDDDYCYGGGLVEDEIHLYCDETNLDEIYEDVSKETVRYSLTIKNTAWSQMDVNPTTWNNIFELSMSNTSTVKIVPGFFNKLVELKTLEITNNNLSGIVDGTFSALGSLKRLNLSYNAITYLSEHSFSGLLELKFLDLSYNNISFMDSKVFSLNSDLRYVHLGHNFLANVEFTVFQNVFTIDLSSNRLTNFSFSNQSISNSNSKFYKSVEFFNISGNFFEIIEEHFVGPEVDTADLSYNLITALSKDAFSTALKLQYLYLNNNKLTSIHKATFRQQINLKYLDLSSNPIVTIPFGLMNNLNSLIYLDLSNSKALLDFHFLFTLKKLKILKISNTNMKNFDINLIVSYLNDLKKISFSNSVWTCKELLHNINIFQKNNITVLPGNNTETQNFFGISCLDSENAKEETITINRNNDGKDDSSRQDSLEKFLDSGFKNTAFYKFFESFNNFRNSSTVPEKNSITLNLDKNLTNSNLYKLLLQNIIHDISVSQIPANMSTNVANRLELTETFFNKDFKNTSFYKFFESFKNFQNSNQMPDKNSINQNVDSNFTNLNLYKLILQKILDDIPVSQIASNISTSLKNQLELKSHILILDNKTMSKNTDPLGSPSQFNFLKNFTFQQNEQIKNNMLQYQNITFGALSKYFEENPVNHENLIFMDIMVFLVLVCIVFYIYYSLFRQKKPMESREGVQLI